MRRTPLLMIVLAAFAALRIAAGDPAPSSVPEVLPGFGAVHHPVSTKNAEAQRFFDQGMAMLYGFNHDEAQRAFEQAAALDPQLAMAWWGIALVQGPNYNLPVDPVREKSASDAARKALALSAGAPENEQAYIRAVAARYSADPKADYQKLSEGFAKAMGELVKQYPDDLDAATIYAESLMDLHPWQLWKADGTAEAWTGEIVSVLESVLRRNPDHLGANHYYVHAVEASAHPERALPSAERLKTLAPAAGHLVHMPAHIYIRTGDYEGASRANRAGLAADEAYFKARGRGGVYPMIYYTHNYQFLAAAEAMAGRYQTAFNAALGMEKFFAPHAADPDMAMAEGLMAGSTLIRVRFHHWDEILKQAPPDKKLANTTALWRFARGMAFAGKGDAASAQAELDKFDAAAKKTAPDAPYMLNTAADVLKVARELLSGAIAHARHDDKSALPRLRAAVAAQDALHYDEPADWFYPVRETLGAALLRDGDAAGAEQVFRDDLEKNPRNGRSLFGLQESLKARNQPIAAALVGVEYEAAWKNADGPLRLGDF